MRIETRLHVAAAAAFVVAAWSAPAAAYPEFYDFEKHDHRNPNSAAIPEGPATIAGNVKLHSDMDGPTCIKKWTKPNLSKPWTGLNVLIGATTDAVGAVTCNATRKLRIRMGSRNGHYFSFYIIGLNELGWKVTAVRHKADTVGTCIAVNTSECVFVQKRFGAKDASPGDAIHWAWVADPASKISSVYVEPWDGSPPTTEFGLDGVIASIETSPSSVETVEPSGN